MVLPWSLQPVCSLTDNIADGPSGTMDEHPLVEVVAPEGPALVHRKPVPMRHLSGNLDFARTGVSNALTHPTFLGVVPVLVAVDVESLVLWAAHEVCPAGEVGMGVWTMA